MTSPEIGGGDQPGRTGDAAAATCCAKSRGPGANGLSLLGAAPHLTGSDWANGNAGSIYYTAGNVGIGTIYPAAALDVYGFGANAWTYLRGNLNGFATPTVNYGMMVGWNPSGGGGETQVLYGTSLGGSPRLDFGRWDGTTKTIDLSLNNGSLGIGTMTPAYSLDVSGTINSTAATDNGPSLSLTNPKKTIPGIANRWALYNMTGAAGNSLQFWNYDISGCLPSGMCNSRLTVTDAGKVGIGTSAPGWSLDVAGDINFSGTLRYQGAPALQASATSGQTAYGAMALQGNTTGTNNTATGYNALALNTSGRQNTSSGGYALFSNTTGSFNTAYGYGALQSSTTGTYSTAIGYSALGAATGAGYNTAVGGYALATNTIGQDNAAIGYSALRNSTVATQSTAVGNYSLYTSRTGANNTALGAYALYFATGSNNIGIGYQAGYFPGANGNTTSNNIHIGSSGTATDNATIRIGTVGTQTSFYAAGIFGVTAGASAVPIYIDSTGHLGTVQSSRRFKEDIRDMGETSRGLMRLRPVTFRYRQPFADGSKPRQYGLIAEEVAEIYPDLVVRSADGRIETVKYQVLDSMLLNEVQRQQKQIESQEARIRRLEENAAEQSRRTGAMEQRISRLEALLGATR